MANYKFIDGKIYREVGTNDLEQVRLKITQVVNAVTPLQEEVRAKEAEINRLENDIAIKKKTIEQYVNAIADIELIKTAFPEQAKKLGF